MGFFAFDNYNCVFIRCPAHNEWLNL